MCLAVGEHQIVGGKTVPYFGPRNTEEFGGWRRYNTFRKSTTAIGPSCVENTQVGFSQSWLEKIPAWQLTKVRNKKEVIAEARNKGNTVHVASLMDLCHLKNSELEPQFQKYKGRDSLRGDTVKDDSGSHAEFTEQGSSASQRTVAKVMDIISRLPGCVGQAADAVSAYA